MNTTTPANELINVRFEWHQILNEHHDLDLTDDRGRAIGARLVVERVECIEDPESSWLGREDQVRKGVWYNVTTQSTRNGAAFGACNSGSNVDTLDEAYKLKARKLRDTLKRYTRLYGPG